MIDGLVVNNEWYTLQEGLKTSKSPCVAAHMNRDALTTKKQFPDVSTDFELSKVPINIEDQHYLDKQLNKITI